MRKRKEESSEKIDWAENTKQDLTFFTGDPSGFTMGIHFKN